MKPSSNENGKIIIQFAEENNMIIKSTSFAHKDIHKETWMSPDGKTRNRIDHILIEKRIHGNVRSFGGADANSTTY
jgi:predicted class III extradiol MEMO1 family dioxygenase